MMSTAMNPPTPNPPTTIPTAYTDAPALHPNLILGSLHLLFWLIFHPAAWRNHVARIDPTLRPGFCLLELRRAQWRNPALRRLLLQGYVVVPLLVALLVGLVVRLPRGVSVGRIAGSLTVSLPLSLPVGLVFGLACGVAGGMTGSPAAAVVVFSTVLLLHASGLTGSTAGLVAMAVAVFVAGGVASGVAGGVERQGRGYSVARQIRSVIRGVLISGVVAGVGFGAGFGVLIVTIFYAAAGKMDAAMNMINNITPLMAGVASGVALGVGHGLALGLAGGLRTGSWRRGVALGVGAGIAVGAAVGAAVGPNEPSGAFIVFFSASFGALFALPFVIADRIAGAWAGAVAGALGGGGAWMAQNILSFNIAFWPTVPLSLTGFFLGVTLPLWRPILLYPFLAAYNLVLYRVDERRAPDRPALLRYHSAFWDEHQHLPLLGLDNHVVLVAERNADEGQAAIEYLTGSRQRWAAQAAQIELDARRLECYADVEAIGHAHRSLAAAELDGPASALLRSFSSISQDVDAALCQESAYNQRLALSAVEDRLNGLLRELTRSSERYDVRFRPVAIEWHRIVADKVRALAAAEARDRG